MTYDKQQIDKILADHASWVRDPETGARANLIGAVLSGADLSWANLSRTNLSWAYLSGADLTGADLSGAVLIGADLSWAVLRGADLRGANLSEADLRGAVLSRAVLRGATLSGANLTGANLSEANLSGAYLSGADLSGADLSGANLRGANLRGANLSGAQLPGFQIPQTGTLEVWKKLADGSLAKLQVLAGSPRTATPVGRKCRAKSVLVLEGGGASQHDPRFKYTPGAVLTVDNYDPDIRVECAPGIHFFLTHEEAEAH